jgi:hypothetical protein
VQDKDANGKIWWRNTVSKTEQPVVQSDLVGEVAIVSPLAGTLSNVKIAVTGGSGTCTAPLCPTTALPFGDPVVCTFTCQAGVTSVTPSCDINGTPLGGDPAVEDRTVVFGDSACVTLSDDLFAADPSSGWAGDKTICWDTTPSPYVVEARTQPPQPPSAECFPGDPSYDVVNAAVLKLLATNATLVTQTATATVACPDSVWTVSASGTAAQAWSW